MNHILIIALVGLSVFCVAQVPGINMFQLATGYSSPVDIKNCGDQRLFVVEQAGYIRILYKNGTKQTTPFLDIHTRVQSAGNEQGLLTMAFSPNYKQDGYFYVNYINGTSAGSTRISRFSVLPNDSTQADPNSEMILLSFTQPETNHNGSTLMFGRDGYLYDSQGDGGGAGDVHSTYGNGQNKNTYLAKMLRLDVSNHDTTYTIPATNPFVGQANTKAEIWAYGLRNPWRCSFDRLTGDMWIGDVGQDTYEEVDFQSVSSTGGENYGWRCREGMHNYNTTGCVSSGFVEPVFEYSHVSGNCSMTGGYVYRGAQFSKLFGRYLHSDFCSGRIWSIKNSGNNTFLVDSPTVYVNGVAGFSTNNIGTFGQDNLGELYIGGRANGRIYHLTETTDCSPVAFISLNDTVSGCSPVTISALQGDTLSYQWYNSTGVINGATAYQYPAEQSGWYKVKVSKTLHSGCEAISDSVYVNIYDTTSLALCNCIYSACNNTLGTLSLSGYVSPTGGVYSGTGVSNNQFTTLNQTAGNYDIAYAYTNQHGCVSHTSFQITVNDTSALTVIRTNNKYCVDDTAVSLSGIVQPLGGLYYSGAVTNDSIFNPALAGVGVLSIPYAYSDNNNCQSIVYVDLEVGAETQLIGHIPLVDYCNNSSDFSLNGFVTPTGGVYSGNGVTNSTFSPSAAGLGVATVYYNYSNNFGCTSRDTIGLNVVSCTGISEITNELVFSIFPNPTKGNFNLTVHVSSVHQAELVITDVLGKVCYRKNQLLEPNKPVIAVELPQLAKGNYTVQLKAGKANAVKSLVIE